jgi:cytochrome b6-f complex iron-sulfur subunit
MNLKKMNRKEFITQVGLGSTAILLSSCLSGLSGCKKSTTSPINADFTVDTSSGSLSNNGGYLEKDGVIVARTIAGDFIAVSVSCTHEGTSVNYNVSSNNFICPNHGAKFDSNGTVTQGPANKNLTKYNTALTGATLRVYS